MSMDICKDCGKLVDTDEDPDCFLVSKITIGLPQFQQIIACVCESCRIDISDRELEARQPA
jgi:hypothetical protein